MKIEFKGRETFSAYNKAEQWCRDNGYSVAPMCCPLPTGLVKGDVYIAKYRNLTARERRELHGTITGNFREGPVVVTLLRGWEHLTP